MSSKTTDSVSGTLPAKHPVGSGADRRERWRIKVVSRVLIRGGVGTVDAFEDTCKSIDATRDGLLVSTSRGGYWVGQPLQVIFPYSSTPTAINVARKAKVVRNVLMPDFRYSVAMRLSNGQDIVASEGPSSKLVRVLGVESDPVAASLMRDLLQHDGYQVVFVSTAQDAVVVLMNETPDVLIAESEGIGMSGRDLCAMIKRNERLQHVPVILLSALPSAYSANYGVGAVVSITKPCPT
jgi:CheY-like chemotaxis protein